MGTVEMAEQVASAISNGNLMWERGSLDRVVALGVTGLRVRNSMWWRHGSPKLLVRLATAAYRLRLVGDAKEYPDAEDAVRALARSLNNRWNWRSSPGGLARMSRTVLRYWLMDNCLECTGRKFQAVPGTPTLSARVCPECGGSGKAPKPWAESGLRGAVLRAREGEHHDALFAELQSIEYDTSQMLAAVLKSRGV